MSLSIFDTLSDGRHVQMATLSWPGGAGGLQVEILDYGATIHRIVAEGANGPVDCVVGCKTLSDYEITNYLGPVVGRCANRIGGSTFTIDGETFHVTANEGANCLHGGPQGFDKRLWRFQSPAAPDARRVSLIYVSDDGEEGFPGRVEVHATYELTGPDTLLVTYEARTDKPTPVNLSQHVYFNLSGDPQADILEHTLKIAADHITPVHPDLIPTGELMTLAGTPFDLREARRIGDALDERHPQLDIAKGFDHNWALDAEAEQALELHSPKSGLTLTIKTDQVGIQVYSGQGLTQPLFKHAAIVFEPQGFPDAVNQPSFPDVVLRPGQVYRHRSSYRFAAS
jgi:aldose 1-epimerase